MADYLLIFGIGLAAASLFLLASAVMEMVMDFAVSVVRKCHKEEKKKGSKIMKSKWKVTYNPMMESKPYAVVRLRNTSECEHSGNREYGSEYMATREEAQAIADKLNAEENQHYTAKAETADD